jgi:ABC-type transporter Mla subunit MlaD
VNADDRLEWDAAMDDIDRRLRQVRDRQGETARLVAHTDDVLRGVAENQRRADDVLREVTENQRRTDAALAHLDETLRQVAEHADLIGGAFAELFRAHIAHAADPEAHH